MNKFQKIKEIIKEYQTKSDKFFTSYKAEEAKARKKYSEQGFKTEFIPKVWAHMAGEAQAEASITIKQINDIFDEIKEDFEKWVMKPLDPGVAQILGCVNQFDLSLSLDELRIIENSARGSYMSTRIFAGLAEKNGYGVSVPSMKDLMDALESARDNAAFSINAYAGHAADNFSGRDLIGDWTFNGISYGAYSDHHMVMAELFLGKDCELDRLERLWDSTNAPMAYTLNPTEIRRIKKRLESIVNKNGEIDEKAACQLKENDPNFIDKLRSIPEGSFEKMDSVSKYFRLDESDNKKNESAISQAIEQAKSYNERKPKPVDMKIVNQN